MPGELSRRQASTGFYAVQRSQKPPPIPAFCRTRQRLSGGLRKTDPYAPFYDSNRATGFKQFESGFFASAQIVACTFLNCYYNGNS